MLGLFERRNVRGAVRRPHARHNRCDPFAGMPDPKLHIKRIYEARQPSDGFRVLVDRLWPRGLTKQRAALDAWERDLAPSPALRKWFGHDPKRWAEFRKRYRAELSEHGAELAALRARAKRKPVTLLYAAKDPQINHAVVLRKSILSSPARGFRSPLQKKP
jgi:uncharacterized protein YeaO (DUF488 family)